MPKRFVGQQVADDGTGPDTGSKPSVANGDEPLIIDEANMFKRQPFEKVGFTNEQDELDAVKQLLNFQRHLLYTHFSNN